MQASNTSPTSSSRSILDICSIVGQPERGAMNFHWPIFFRLRTAFGPSHARLVETGSRGKNNFSTLVLLPLGSPEGEGKFLRELRLRCQASMHALCHFDPSSSILLFLDINWVETIYKRAKIRDKYVLAPRMYALYTFRSLKLTFIDQSRCTLFLFNII